MKMRNKGKVYPSSSSPLAAGYPPLFVLNLLPATILDLAVLLSVEDREVLAYMITRSIKSTNPNPNTNIHNKKTTSNTHKPPVFDCDCFDCYTSFWFKWDSSPNRELIHQIIEAFEDTLTLTNATKSQTSKKKAKKRDKMAIHSSEFQVLPECNVPPPVEEKVAETVEDEVPTAEVEVEVEAEEVEMVRGTAASQNKGLVRKVLPDVIGLLNWRLWSLWNPNV